MTGTLLIATHNAHKTGEMRAILADHFETITDLTSLPGMTPPEETGTTFAENSAIKALAASRAMPEAFVLADDSGLEVDALGGPPGLFSSLYSRSDRTAALYRGTHPSPPPAPPPPHATLRPAFGGYVSLGKGGGALVSMVGAVGGGRAGAETGTGGLGYDALWIPDGREASFGELPESVKNGMSHRARALEKFRRWLARD